MQRQTFLAVLGCLWIGGFAVLFVYFFPMPREAVLRTLSAREGADPISTEALRVLSARASAAAVLSAAAIATAATSTDYQPVTLYDYRLLQNVDPCTLTKLGAQGWNIYQMGGNIITVGGSDEACQTSGIVSGFDWVLFYRSHIPVSSTGGG